MFNALNDFDQTIVHKLVLKANGAETACKLNVVALYPINWYAMTDEAGKSNIRVTLNKGVTCPECKKKLKGFDALIP